MPSTITLIVLTFTIILFMWGRWKPDVVALMSMMALFFTGVLTASEALSGFSSSTVIMIGALFIIGEGLAQTGWTAVAGQKFITWAKGSKNRMMAILIGGAGLLSGFVSNTGTVATLLPLAVNSAWNMGSFPSKMLIPVAYGANTGGLLTLTGTPPNIVVNDALTAAGFDSFFFFEFALIGLPLLVLTILYFRFAESYVLPAYKTRNRPVNLHSEILGWMDAYQVDDNYYRLRVRSISPFLGTRIEDWDLEENYNVSIIKLKRRHPNPLRGIPPFIEFPDRDTIFMYHDLITVKGEPKMIEQMMLKYRLGLWPCESGEEELEHQLLSQEVGMAEMIVTPKSSLVGKRIVLGEYLKHLNIQLLAASRNNHPIDKQQITIQAGDAFLIRGTWNNIEALKLVHKNIAIAGRPEAMTQNIQQLTPRSFIALGALATMVLLLVFKVMPGAFAALLGAGIVVLTGCVAVDKAYQTVSWSSLVMLAAMIPMGVALEKTGITTTTANTLVEMLGERSPLLLLSGVFLLTTLFSQTINNTATAVLMAPLAIMAAAAMGISPKPFMVAVAVSASTAFLTPVGTTTNAMVMAAGGYKFADYVRAGTPLLVLFFVLSMWLIPWFWPF